MECRLGVRAVCKSQIGVIGALGFLALTVAACGGGVDGAEPTALPPVVVPDQPTVIFPTLIPIQPGPTLTPTPVLVEEAQRPPGRRRLPVPAEVVTEGTVNTAGLRFRSAPDISTGAVLAELSLNTRLYIYGRNADSTWLNVARETGGEKGWVFALYVNLDRGVEQLPEAGTDEAGPPASETALGPNLNESPLVAQFFIEAVAVPLQEIELKETPKGATIATVSEGEYVTALARSADGQWLAVYTNALILEERQYGWIASGTVKLYGGENLPRTSSNTPWLELPD